MHVYTLRCHIFSMKYTLPFLLYREFFFFFFGGGGGGGGGDSTCMHAGPAIRRYAVVRPELLVSSWKRNLILMKIAILKQKYVA